MSFVFNIFSHILTTFAAILVGFAKCLLWCFAVVFRICFWTSYLSYYTFKTSAFQSHYKKAEEHLLCFYKQSVSKLLGWPKSWGH